MKGVEYVRSVLDDGLTRDWLLLGIGGLFIQYRRGKVHRSVMLDDPDLCPSTPNFYPGLWVVDRRDGEFPIRPGEFSRGFGIQLHPNEDPEFPEDWEPCAGLETNKDEIEVIKVPELEEVIDLLLHADLGQTPALMVDRRETLTLQAAWREARFEVRPALIRSAVSKS